MWTALLFNRFTLYAALAAAAAAGFYAYRGSLIQQGYDTAIQQVREAETDRLREQIRETGRLVGVVKGLQDVADKQKQSIAAFRARQRADDQRLRDQEADHQQRLTAAGTEAVRGYATHLDGHLEECRSVVAGFASEAASCAVAAHTLNDYVKERP